jgi:hypothetical protein
MTSVLYNPMIDSASALSQESPTLPTEGSKSRLFEALGVANRKILRPADALLFVKRRCGFVQSRDFAHELRYRPLEQCIV